MRRIAVLHVRRIGDFLCATPAWRALRGLVPQAEITLIGLPWVADLVERSTSLDRFVPFPGYPGIAEQFFEARRAAGFFEAMQAERFDLAIQMHGSGVCSNPATLMLGARWTVGFVRAGDPAGRLDAAYPWSDSSHETVRMLSLMTFLGAESPSPLTEFPLLEEDHRQAEQLLAGVQRPLVGFHVGAREATKRWPAERFAELGNNLQHRHGGTLVLLGSANEQALVQEVEQRLRVPSVNLLSKTSLGPLGAVIARLDLLVTNDSGPAHIAYAVGTRSVTLFGATNPAIWGPLNQEKHQILVNPVSCWPCEYHECPHSYECLHGISVTQVAETAGRLINAG